MDYQKTLNLPKTEFAMRAGLVEKEPQQLKRWAQECLFTKIRTKSQGKPKFILHDGPPYANGNIHIGHALNKTLKDVIVKMKTMQGFDSYYIPGWDCHGLPIEHQLFKDLKKRKSDVEPVEFRRKAREFALKYVEIQKEQFKRLGVFGDWDNPYLTLTPEYGYWILNTLARLYEKGFVYRGLKPVNWCTNCETALAEAEVEYEDHASPSVYVKFKVKNPEALKGLPKNKPVYLLIWTTTPWTLMANVAVAVHPTFEYAIVDDGGEIIIVEESLAETVMAKRAEGQRRHQRLMTVKGGDLRSLKYQHVFGIETNCCVITADYVTKEDGTGLVHIAPGHGQEDFEAGLANNLEVRMPVDDRGVYTEEAGEFAGLPVFKANEKIIESLHQRNILYNKPNETIPHSYPHCWRCKKPVIFRATKQWFLKIDHENLRGRLKDIINEKVAWIPPMGRERILGMVSGRPDWCLSRQRYWGVPIPALICKGCGEHKLIPGVIRRYADLARKEGTDVWFIKDVKEFAPAGVNCPDCGGKQFEKTYDILDVWFDSGVSHQAVALPRFGQPIPVDMYLEGSDQHRGWFQSSLIPAVALENKAPYRQVLTHGFVVDGQGRKMSKSLGNVISPQDEMKQHGADILRLWVAASSYNEDIRLSKEILERLVDAYRKIRNTFRYLLGNLDGFFPDQDAVAVKDLYPIDRWALDRLGRMLQDVKDDYNRYEFARVYKTIYAFCNEDLSSFYLDILKDRLYTSSTFSLARRSAQTVLYHILNHLVRIAAPTLTFTAEEIYGMMPKSSEMKGVSSIHLLEWLDISPSWNDEAIRRQFDRLMALRPGVMKAIEDKRSVGEIGSSLEAKLQFVCSRDSEWEYLNGLKSFLPFAFIVSQVELERGETSGTKLDGEFAHTSVTVARADGTKCARCWNYSVHVGEDAEHPALCERCVKVLSEPVTSRA